MLVAVLSNTGIVSLLGLLLLPPLSILLMSLLGKPERVALYIVWGNVLFGPVGSSLKFPMMPYISKDNIAYISVLIASVIMARGHLKKGRPGSWPGSMLFIVAFGAILTAVSNADMLVFKGYAATVVIPGLNIKDGAYMAITNMFSAYFPFLVGFTFVRDAKTMRFMARLLMSILAIMAVLMLIELKMSPQLHHWVYGYAAHAGFGQTRRWGGWRPMLFMRHGLAVSLLVYNCGMATIGMSRTGERPMLFGRVLEFKWKYLLWVCFVLLILTKSTASIIYGVLFYPLAAKAKPVWVLRVAMVLAMMALLYPVARSYELVPTQAIIDGIEDSLGEERAQSMKFRFGNEDLLMNKARDRLTFGWGQYGRQFLYRYDGKQATVPDGYWIIVVGARGLFGFIPAFLILLYPVFMGLNRYRFVKNKGDLALLSSMTLAQATCVADLIPNGLLNTYPYFIAGALCALWSVLGDRNAKAEDHDEQEGEPGKSDGGPGDGGSGGPNPDAQWPGYAPQPGYYPPQPGYPPQGYPPQPSYPPQGYPAQPGYPPQPPPGGWPPQGGGQP